MYTLFRHKDGAGDMGGMSEIFQYAADRKTRINLEVDSRPRIGFAIRVGSGYARSYQQQDFWTTTEVLEIIEESNSSCTFRTKNSIYTWSIV